MCPPDCLGQWQFAVFYFFFFYFMLKLWQWNTREWVKRGRPAEHVSWLYQFALPAKHFWFLSCTPKSLGKKTKRIYKQTSKKKILPPPLQQTQRQCIMMLQIWAVWFLMRHNLSFIFTRMTTQLVKKVSCHCWDQFMCKKTFCFFSSVVLLLELPPTGGALPSPQITSTYLFRYETTWDNCVLACEVWYCVFFVVVFLLFLYVIVCLLCLSSCSFDVTICHMPLCLLYFFSLYQNLKYDICILCAFSFSSPVLIQGMPLFCILILFAWHCSPFIFYLRVS